MADITTKGVKFEELNPTFDGAVVVTGNFTRTGRLSVTGDVNVIGATDLTIPQGRKISLDGGGHTYISEVSDSNLKIYVAASEIVNFTNDQVVFSKPIGIGATPNQFHDDADDLIVGGGSGNTGLTIQSGQTGYGSIFFADGTADDATEKRGQIRYLQGTERMDFHTDNVATAALSLAANGDATFSGFINIPANKYITTTVPSGGGTWFTVSHTGNESWTWGAQSGSGSDDYLDVGIGGGTRVMSWHEDGKVGIGSTAPAALLEIVGEGDAIRVESTNTGAAGAQLDLLHFTTSPADEDVNGLINFGGYYTGTTSAYATQIKSVWTDVSERHGRLEFYTVDTSLNKVLTLDHEKNATFAGNITVSNASPALNLTDTDNSSNIAISSVGGALIANSTSDQVYQIGGSEYFRIATSLVTSAVNIQSNGTSIKVTNSGNANFYAASTGSGYAGLYLDAVNGDFAGGDYFSLRQLDNKAIEFNARASAGNTLFYSKGSLNLTMDGTASTFAGNVTVSGNLEVTGTTTTTNAVNLDLSDNIIGLNRGASTNANDSGIIIERGSTGHNAAILWDESNDDFIFGLTTATPAATGNIALEDFSSIKAKAATFSNSVTIAGGTYTDGIVRSRKNIVSNSTYNVISLNSSRSINDYGGLNKDYMKIDLETPGPNTDGGSSAHGLGHFSLKLANDAGNTNMGEVLHITHGGNATFPGKVGIGTSPGMALHVKAGDEATMKLESTSGEPAIFWAPGGSSVKWEERASASRWQLYNYDQSTWVFNLYNKNVGIGTQSPSKFLTIYGDTPFIRLEDDQGGNKRLDLWVDSNAVAHIDANQSASQITLRTASTDRLRITNAGKVGMGLTSPDSKLHVEFAPVALNTTNLDNSSAVGLSVTIPDAELSGGEGVALALGMNGRGRSYIANNFTGTNKDASDLVFYTESGGVISEQLRIDQNGHATFKNYIKIADTKYAEWGNAADFKIHHNGSATYLQNYTGHITIQQNTNDGDMIFQSDDGSGGVAEYYRLDGGDENNVFSRDIVLNNLKSFNLSDRYQIQSFELPYFTNSTANLAADIILPNESINGVLELRLQSGYSYQNATGDAYFKWIVGLNADGSIWYTPKLVESFVTNQAASQIYVDDPAWDSTNNRYYIRVYHKVSTGNVWEGTLTLTSQGGGTINAEISTSSLLTSTSTANTHPVGKYYSDNTGDVNLTLKSQTAGDPTIILDSAAANRSGLISFKDQGTQIGQIAYHHNGDTMEFYTGGTGSTHKELTLNETTGATFLRQLNVGSGKKIYLGGSEGRMHVYHTGSGGHAYLLNKEGALYITQEVNDGNIVFTADNGAGGNAVYFTCDGGSATHDGSTTTALYTKWPDQSRIALGSGHDLQLYHDSTNSTIRNAVGNLDFELHTNDGNMRFYNDDGAGSVSLYYYLAGAEATHDGSKVTALYTIWPDFSQIALGGSKDLRLYHNASASFINNHAGDLNIANYADDKDIRFHCDDGSGGLVEYFRLDGGISSLIAYKDLLFGADAIYAKWGASQDLVIGHDGSNSKIENSTGHLYFLQNTDDKDIIFQVDDGSGGLTSYLTLDGSQTNIHCQVDFRIYDHKILQLGNGADGEIYHDGSDLYITNTTGDMYLINKADDKDIIFQSDNGSGGYTTYFFLDGSETRTTFNKEARFIDNAKLKLGTSGDLEIFHDGSNTYLENYTGSFIFTQALDDGDMIFKCDNGSGGTTEYMRLDGSQESIRMKRKTKWDDNIKATFGDGEDLEIYHDGTHSYIDDVGTGSLYIKGGSSVQIESNTGENMIVCSTNAAVELYYNNSKKLETNSDGVSATGYYDFESTGSGYGFKYGVSPGTTQGIAIKASDTGGAYFDGLGYFWNNNTGNGAGMFQMQNDGDTYCRYINFYRGANDNIIGYIGYNSTNTAVTYSTSSSDERLKKNIVAWNESVLPKFLALQPKKFNFKASVGDPGPEKIKGYIAQNEVDNFPEVYQLNGQGDDARYGFHPMEMVPYLMKAVKELVEKNQDLEARIAELEK